MAIISSYSESNCDQFIEASGDYIDALAQSFVNTDQLYLLYCKFYIARFGSPTGNISAKIYSHSGEYGVSSMPDGPALATSDPINIQNLSTSSQLVTFMFSGTNRITLNASTNYVLSIEYAGGEASVSYLKIGIDVSLPAHDGNYIHRRVLETSSWVSDSSKDLCFYVYGSATLPVEETKTLDINSLLKKSISKNPDIDSYIRKRFNKLLSIDALTEYLSVYLNIDVELLKNFQRLKLGSLLHKTDLNKFVDFDTILDRVVFFTLDSILSVNNKNKSLKFDVLLHSQSFDDRQNSLIRKPEVQILASSLQTDIPFDGQFFNNLTLDETVPNMVALSSGRLVCAFVRDNNLYINYTDNDRTKWFEELIIDDQNSYPVIEGCPFELADGRVGIAYITGNYLRLVQIRFGTIVGGVSENDFSNDANCIGLFKFEPGNLMVNSKGPLELIVGENYDVYDFNSTEPCLVVAATEAGNYKRGSQAAMSWQNSNGDNAYYYCNGINSNWPLLTGDTNKTASFCTWIKFSEVPVNDYEYFIYSNPLYFYIKDTGSGSFLYIQGQMTGGTYFTPLSIGTPGIFQPNTWYHIGISFDGVNHTYIVRIWDDTAQTAQTFTGSYAGAGSEYDLNVIASSNFQLPDANFNGNDYGEIGTGFVIKVYTDEFAVFNSYLSAANFDTIRNGGYDFINDANCMSLWTFESPDMKIDSKGNHNVNDNGYDGNVYIGPEPQALSITTDIKQGLGAVQTYSTYYENYDWSGSAFVRTRSYDENENVITGLPLMTGDTDRIVTMASWVRFDILPTIYDADFFNCNGRVFLSITSTRRLKLSIYRGSYADYYLTAINTLELGTWYHIGISVDGLNHLYTVRIYNSRTDTADTYTATWSAGSSYDIPLTTFSYINIGNPEYSSGFSIDEFVVFDKMLSDTDFDAIRAKVYGYNPVYVGDDVTIGLNSLIATADWVGTFPYSSNNKYWSYIYFTNVNAIKYDDNSYQVTCSLINRAYNGSGLDPDTYYYLVKFTSSNLTSWSSQTVITLTGLTTTNKKAHPNVMQISSNEVFLFFAYTNELREDGSELINIYYIKSNDRGVTWTDPVKLTNFTIFGRLGSEPYAAMKSASEFYLAYTEQNNVLHLSGKPSGFSTCETGGYCPGTDLMGTDLHYYNNKLYVKDTYFAMGTKCLCACIVIDVPTFTIEKCYTTESDPPYNAIFANSAIWPHRNIDTGDWFVASTKTGHSIMVINTTSNFVRYYQFMQDNGTYGIPRNVVIDFGLHNDAPIEATYLDYETNRLYVLLVCSYFWHPAYWIGYIDLNEQINPSTGLYTWNQVAFNNMISDDHVGGGVGNGTVSGICQMQLFKDAGLIAVSFYSIGSGYKGRLCVHTLADGGLWKDYLIDTNPNFHYNGINWFTFSDWHIYGGFNYMSTNGQAERKGLMDINLRSGTQPLGIDDSITYHQPTYKTANDYAFETMTPTNDGRIIIGTRADGIVIYKIVDQTWERFTNTELPGLTPYGDGVYVPTVAYDESTGRIFGGAYGAGYVGVAGGNWCGVLSFLIGGSFLQTQYFDVIWNGENWSFGEATPLLQGISDYDSTIIVDKDGALWAVWVNENYTNNNEKSLKWDKEGIALDVSPYLVRGDELTVDYDVENPNVLRFSLSNGHLFDPNNLMSTMSKYLQKGNKIDLKFGERIQNIISWKNQGSFVVDEIGLNFQRGEYPVMNVMCSDKRKIWNDINIITTEYYDNEPPELVLIDMITEHGGMEESDLDIPAITGITHNLYHQFINQNLFDSVKQITNHFGYFSYMDYNSKFTIKKVDLSESPSHIYPDTSFLISVTPDDSFSSYTNKVTVKGEMRATIEALFAEESVGTISGTVGWWHDKKKIETVWYSTDHLRQCRNPRLDVKTSVKDFFLFKLSAFGANEYIYLVDPFEKYVQIAIEGPTGLTFVFIATAALLIAVGFKALTCTLNCGPYITATSILLNILLYIFACVANYQYEIWARPVGHEKQMIQGTAEDYEFQRKIGGIIVPVDMEDSLCYEIAHCDFVAEHELAIVKAQRRGLEIKKISHLDDEIGNIIQIIHPYGEYTMNIFIHSLSRKFKKSDENSEGYMVDVIKGWRLD